jgi:hypothetical protein
MPRRGRLVRLWDAQPAATNNNLSSLDKHFVWLRCGDRSRHRDGYPDALGSACSSQVRKMRKAGGSMRPFGRTR